MTSLGGSINLESELGQGACFSFTLTLNRVMQSMTDAENAASDAADTAMGPEQDYQAHSKYSLNVLLVEDNLLAQKLTAAVLRDLTDTVHVAGSATEAIAEIENNTYDLVITDIGLPDMDGFALAQQINQLNPAPLIIGLTAHVDADRQTQAQAAGLFQLLPKPITTKAALKLLFEVYQATQAQKAQAAAEPVT